MTDDMFIHENLNASENRINVALFGLMAVREVRLWLLERLGLPTHAALFPPKNLEGDSRRPDLRVVDPGDEKTLAWIEVEITSDLGQLEGYRKACAPDPVFALWGHRSHGGDLSLEELAAHLETLVTTHEDTQVRFNIRHLMLQIEEALEGRPGTSYKRAPVSEKMLGTPLLAGLRERLGGMVRLDPSGVMTPRTVLIDTNMPNGFSVRVYTREASKRSLSVLSRRGGKPRIVFPSRDKVLRCLPHKGDDVNVLVTLVREMGGDMDGITGEQRTSVSLDEAEARVDDLAATVRALAV